MERLVLQDECGGDGSGGDVGAGTDWLQALL